MSASLGLKLYNLAHRREPGPVTQRALRPPGRLAWLHVPSEAQVSPMLALARRMIEEDGIEVLLTCPFEVLARVGVTTQPPPGETPGEAHEFLDYWRPEIVVFAEGELRPAILHQAAVRKIPVMLVNGRAPRFMRDRDGWYPGLMRSALAQFSQIFVVDEAAAKLFRKGGASVGQVAVTGRLEEESSALPCHEAERAALAALLATRPVWFAAGLPASEEAAVLRAHRAAVQHSHRLLLVLAPDDPGDAAAWATRLENTDGWGVALRSRDEEPGPEVEILVVDNPAEYGLWYRLAPITFLGGSLSGNGPSRHPFEAAALGSAILHGPRTGRYGPAFGRLGPARATRAVASASDLADALGDVLSPDRAARLAQAAWAVVSEGSEVTDALLGRIRKLMDGDP